MARFNFKDNPVLNDETFIGNQKFRWNGTAWAREQFDLNSLLSQLKQESVTEAVQSSTQAIVNTAPEALDTIEELATALGNDANFATTITNTLATKANADTVAADLATVNSSLDTKADKTKTLDTITGTPYTLALTDAGKIINCTTNNIVITVPTNLIVNFPIGTEIAFVRLGTQTVEITGSAGVTIQSIDNKRRIKGQYGTAALLKVADNTWVLAGSLEA